MAKFVEYGSHKCLVVSKSFMDRQYDRPNLYTGEVSIIRDESKENLWHRIYHCYTSVDDEGEWFATNCDEYGNEEDW